MKLIELLDQFACWYYKEEKGSYTFKKFVIYNSLITKDKIFNTIRNTKRRINSVFTNLAYYLIPDCRNFKLTFKTKYIKLKLKLMNKSNLHISYSPFSESRYIMYDYLDYYVKIRISGHAHTKNDNSDIFVYV